MIVQLQLKKNMMMMLTKKCFLPANHRQAHFGVGKEFNSVPLSIDGSNCFQLFSSVAIDTGAKGEEAALPSGGAAKLAS